MAPPEVDVVVAGAGPAGSAAAVVLARAGWRVLLADPGLAGPRRSKIGETLPAVASVVLRDLALPAIERAGVATLCRGTSATWGGARPLERDAIGDPHGHGWHLDRARFDAWLQAQARAAGAEPCAERVVAGGRARRAALEVQLGSSPEQIVRCRRVVDATGRRAAVARGQGARRERRDRLVAIYAALATDPDDVDARTRVEATPSGWWYSARVGRERIVALLTDADLVEPAWRTCSGFAAELATTRHVVAGRERTFTAAPATTAAHGARLAPAAGDGWLAVGDAALAFDPLSSQGILNALVTGLDGARAVDASLRGDVDAVAGYAHRLVRVWSAYEINRARAYALERRWPDAPFWARRAAA